MQILALFIGGIIIIIAILVVLRLRQLIFREIQKNQEKFNRQHHTCIINQSQPQSNLIGDERKFTLQTIDQYINQQQNKLDSDNLTIPIQVRENRNKNILKKQQSCHTLNDVKSKQKVTEIWSFRQQSQSQTIENIGKNNQNFHKDFIIEPLISHRSLNQSLISSNNTYNYFNQNINQNNNLSINSQVENQQNNDTNQSKEQQDKDIEEGKVESNSSNNQNEISKVQDLSQNSIRSNQDLLNNQIPYNQNEEIYTQRHESISDLTIPIQNEIKRIEEQNDELKSQSQQQSIVIELTSPDNKNQQKYKYIRANKNKIMYVEDNDNYYTGVAFYYKIQYDMDNNPKFEMYEGQFNKGKKSGKGILYGGKSKFINYDGDWKDDQQYKETIEQKQEVQIQNQETGMPRKKLLIFEEGNLVQIDKNIQNIRTIDSQNLWVKYNQQYQIKDMNILKKETSWFTSSIIDGFVQYLNIEMDNYIKVFFKQDLKRYLFCPSYLYTNMSKDRIKSNLITYQNYILEYEPINFNLKTLFSRVYFAINKSNTHFFLLYIDFSSKSLNIVDSISKNENYYKTEIEIFMNIFQEQITSIKQIPCIQQRNNYDCGPHTCLNMYQDFYDQMQKACLQKEHKEINTPLQIREFLYDILKNNDNN